MFKPNQACIAFPLSKSPSSVTACLPETRQTRATCCHAACCEYSICVRVLIPQLVVIVSLCNGKELYTARAYKHMAFRMISPSDRQLQTWFLSLLDHPTTCHTAAQRSVYVCVCDQLTCVCLCLTCEHQANDAFLFDLHRQDDDNSPSHCHFTS